MGCTRCKERSAATALEWYLCIDSDAIVHKQTIRALLNFQSEKFRLQITATEKDEVAVSTAVLRDDEHPKRGERKGQAFQRGSWMRSGRVGGGPKEDRVGVHGSHAADEHIGKKTLAPN